MVFSLKLSFKFAVASLKALLHAFVPNIFMSSSTQALSDINKIIKNSRCATR
jgi:hypothetical protein